MSSRSNFTTEEIEFISENYLSLSNQQLADQMKRSVGGVKTVLKRLKLSRNLRKVWTDEEIRILTEKYPETPSAEIAVLLDIPIHVLHAKAYNLGLQKTDEFKQKTWQKLSDNLQKSGKAHRFQKGQKPWSYGKKIGTLGRAGETQFKKGQRPANSAEVGTISEIKFGYLKIKVAEPNQWQLLNHYIWEQHHGRPVPKGFCFRFIDGNIKNCAIENLELVSLKENYSRNSIHNLPDDLKKTIQTLGNLRRTINRRIKNAEK